MTTGVQTKIEQRKARSGGLPAGLTPLAAGLGLSCATLLVLVFRFADYEAGAQRWARGLCENCVATIRFEDFLSTFSNIEIASFAVAVGIAVFLLFKGIAENSVDRRTRRKIENIERELVRAEDELIHAKAEAEAEAEAEGRADIEAEIYSAIQTDLSQQFELISDAWEMLHKYLFKVESDLSSSDRYRAYSHNLDTLSQRARNSDSTLAALEIKRIRDLLDKVVADGEPEAE